MGKLSTKQKAIGLELRGRLGRPASYGRAHFGFNLLGAEDSLSGTYQRARFSDGRAVSIRPFYWPKNPRTTAQQARRTLFQEAVSAYRLLTPTELNDIKQKGKCLGLTGYNYFIGKYLRAG